MDANSCSGGRGPQGNLFQVKGEDRCQQSDCCGCQKTGGVNVGIAEEATVVLILNARATFAKSEVLQNAVELLRGVKEYLTENIGGTYPIAHEPVDKRTIYL